MEPKFQKIISKYDYADQLAPGGFVIGGKPALTRSMAILSATMSS